MVQELEKFNEPMEITKKSLFLKQQKVFSVLHFQIETKEYKSCQNQGNVW